MGGGRVEMPWFESLEPVMTTGHRVALLEGGRAFFPALEQAIDAALERVFVETYIFHDDPSGLAIARAMVRAAARGVEVHLVVDGFGTPRITGQVQSVLSDSAVRVEAFRPEHYRLSPDRQRLRRLHRKLAVVDGRVAFVGGINLLDDLVHSRHGGRLESPRVDFAVRVEGPLVAHAHVAMQRLWWELRFVNRSLRRPFGRAWQSGAGPDRRRRVQDRRRPEAEAPHHTGPERRQLPDRRVRDGDLGIEMPETVVSRIDDGGKQRAMLMLRDNFRHRRRIERWYLRAIARARNEVLIANAYFVPGRRFRRALIHAAGRGVRVRLLLQGQVEYRLQHWATQALYDELLRAGIEIAEYKSSYLHAKVAVIDSQATVGSSNLDPFSLLLAREANVVVDDRDFAQELKHRIEIVIADGGVPVQLQHHRRRPWPLRVLNRLAFFVLRLGVSLAGEAGRY
ncbi:MAG: cardiolipin synthase ClsB [Burkholderiaceae bacterium]